MNDTAFIPGIDFDQTDPDEVEIVEMVSKQDRADAQARELERLQDRVALLQGVLHDNGIEYED